MKVRVITSVVGLGILALVLCFFDTILFNLALAAVALIAVHEVYMAFSLKAPWVYGLFAAATVLVMLNDGRPLPLALRMPSVLFLLALCLAGSVIVRSQELSFAKVGGMALFSGLIWACFWSMLYVRAHFAHHADAIYFLVLGLGFAWGGDTCAFFAGHAFGRHKLAPVVSPHKTVEGAVGGVLGAMAVGVAITAVYLACWDSPLQQAADSLWLYLVIAAAGLAGGVLGILGDLTASVVKRQCGIKDYGTIFPGHGGILDRFDSVLFVIPFLALLLSAAFNF